LSFAVGGRPQMTALDLDLGIIANDIRRLSEHCPLDPKP
jgi:hypothetical protein